MMHSFAKLMNRRKSTGKAQQFWMECVNKVGFLVRLM